MIVELLGIVVVLVMSYVGYRYGFRRGVNAENANWMLASKAPIYGKEVQMIGIDHPVTVLGTGINDVDEEIVVLAKTSDLDEKGNCPSELEFTVKLKEYYAQICA